MSRSKIPSIMTIYYQLKLVVAPTGATKLVWIGVCKMCNKLSKYPFKYCKEHLKGGEYESFN